MTDPIRFPTRDVPLIGEPLTVHGGWLMAVPISCNCDKALPPLTVLFGPNLPPAVCPGCMNVYGVISIRYDPARNIQLAITVGVIGKAQKQVSEQAVAEKVAEIGAETKH